MSNKRYDAKRDENEREIIDALRELGATVQQISETGAPDLLVGFERRNVLLEVKLPIRPGTPPSKSALNPAQERWHATWGGAPVHVVRSVLDALRAIGAA